MKHKNQSKKATTATTKIYDFPLLALLACLSLRSSFRYSSIPQRRKCPTSYVHHTNPNSTVNPTTLSASQKNCSISSINSCSVSEQFMFYYIHQITINSLQLISPYFWPLLFRLQSSSSYTFRNNHIFKGWIGGQYICCAVLTCISTNTKAKSVYFHHSSMENKNKISKQQHWK